MERPLTNTAASTSYPLPVSRTPRYCRACDAGRRCGRPTTVVQGPLAVAKAEAEACSKALDRRALVASVISLPLVTTLPCRAEGPSKYVDPTNKYQIDVPEGWLSGSGNAPGPGAAQKTTRQALAWFPEGNTDTNITVIVTNIGADFTALGSFGDALQFGENLVASMDRSFLKRAPQWAQPKEGVQEAKLLEAKNFGNMYYVEYTVLKPQQPMRRLLSLVALGHNGRYNKLYTATAQCPESQLETYRPILQSTLRSFRAPNPAL